MKCQPFVFPYRPVGGSKVYVGLRDWWLCPKCWQRFDIDRGGVSSEYPPKHCPGCGTDWENPIHLNQLHQTRKGA